MRTNFGEIGIRDGKDAPDVPAGGTWALFLDVDGTLLDTAPTPQAVSIDAELVALIRGLHRQAGGAVALISGRSMADVDALFEPLRLATAGIHGYEMRSAAGQLCRPALPAGELDRLRNELLDLARVNDSIILEDKGGALALHFRQAPEFEDLLHRRMTEIAAALPPAFELIEGDCVFEIKPAGANKGTAIEAFMREPPFVGRRPIFIGNDTTDLDGFAAVRHMNGLAIAVGARVTADWHLETPAALRAWLSRLIAAEGTAR